MPITLIIIGAGKLAQTLAYLWHDKQQFTLRNIMSRSIESAERAQHFIFESSNNNNQCETVDNLSQATSAQCWLLATPDGVIEETAKTLSDSQLLQPGDIVFHCSGALSSKVLSAVKIRGAHIASVHPVHSFSSPAKSIHTFAGSFCTYEGDEEALMALRPAFENIGAQLLPIEEQQKTLYHAASVLACNYLTALLDTSLKTWEACGIDRQQAQQLLLPIVHQTVDNTLNGSASEALTGPIARGDYETVDKQIQALSDNPLTMEIYKALGKGALNIAREQANLNQTEIDEIDLLLNR